MSCSSYDAIGRLIRTDISKTSTGGAVGSTEYGYNTRGHLTSVTNDIGGNSYGQYYMYSDTGVSGALANAKDGLPTRYRTLGTNTDYSYDSLNRLRKKSIKVSSSLNLDSTYNYKDSLRGSGYTTTQLANESVVGVQYAYSYDNMGNITSITRDGSAYKTYTYDSLGELLTETQHSLNKTDSYGYDPLGNIRTKTTTNTSTNATTEKVTYNFGTDSDAGWSYLLTSITTEDYTSGTKVTTTETIDYDAIGNPLSYRGATMSWFGRQLRTYSKGATTASFAYDADGLRSSKTVNGTKTEYQYVGDQLFYENRGNGNELYYFYDSYGNLTRIYHHNNGNKAAYYVATNAQGDVVALYNASGKKVGAYDYDAWGNQRVFVVTQDSSGANIHTQINPETQYLTHIVNLNPIRYRGYYYDCDLGLYYLQSRYYDSDVGRFINADGTLNGNGDVLGFNMFAYCGNNPVINSDPTGQGFLTKIKSAISTAWNKICVAFNTKILKKQPLPYQTVTEAAIASGNNLSMRTQNDNMEHGQGIIYDKYTDSYGLTAVIDGQHDSVDFGTLLIPKQENLVALVHSHPCCDGHVGNEFSDTLVNPDGSVSGDWVVANSYKIDQYLAAPNGSLYLMSWDIGEYNQNEVSSSLPIDDSPISCGG